MSLLLEALKKAALEKQNRADEAAPVTEPAPLAPSIGDTLDQTDAIEPVLEEPLHDDDLSIPLVEDADVEDFEELAGEEVSETTEETADDNELPDTLIPEAAPKSGELEFASVEEDDLVFEPEFETTEPEAESISDFQVEENPDFDAQETTDSDDFLADDKYELEATETESIDDFIDQEEIDAARQKIEQEQALEEQRFLLEEERIRKEQEERDAEQERIREEQAEAKRQEEAQKNERARQNAQNREALDHLITSGKNIQQQAKRRSAFLYLLLLLTAVGGLSAYYVFLIANTEKNELRSNIVADPNPDVVDVAEMLQEELQPVTDEVNATQNIPEAQPEISQTTPIEGQVGQLAPATAEEQPQSVQAAPLVATRVDPAPSASAYLQPLILSSNGQAQEPVVERVIIHHEAKPASINELISDAYDALQSGEFTKAQALYQRALGEEPDQKDALLGAAAAATALHDYDQATSLYQRRLQVDPSDTYARAGLLGLISNSASSFSVRQEVNAMLRDNPDSAHLHFIKGVGLTTERNWQEAQTAFYEAYRLENTNPDYAFNLAISLDHLNQPSLARVYYERALSLSANRTANFDQNAAQERLAELSNNE